MKFLAVVMFLLSCLVSRVQAEVLEDFEDISDWDVEVGLAALDGSIATDSAEAQEGFYAGALYYELSTAQANDYVFYMLEFASPLNMSDPNLRLQMELKMPNDPHALVQIRLVETRGDLLDPWDDKFMEINLGQGDGLWQSLVFHYHSWEDYGSNPDLSAITAIDIRVIGDLSATASSGTIYVDSIELNRADPMTLALIEDFEDVSDWFVGMGPTALDGSIGLDASQAQVGAYAGALNYDHSTAQGFDYINFGKNTALDLTGADSIDFYMKSPNDPDIFVQLKLYDSSSKFMEYTFPEGDGQWHNISLAVAGAFTDWGNPPDLSDITMIVFHTNGDGSDSQSDGTIYLDQMIISYSCRQLMHDANNDCVVDFIDFADFVSEWLKNGFNAQ